MYQEQPDKLYKEENLLSKELNLTHQEQTLLGRFQRGLQKTKEVFVDDLKTVLFGDEELDEQLFDEIEELLLSADLGVPTSRRILNHLEELYARGVIKNKKQTFATLQQVIVNILSKNQKPLALQDGKTNILLFVGVNGVGKTTTIGKVACLFAKQNKKILLAAGDTYRAAAIEQLTIWAQRVAVEIIAKETGTDAAATIFAATSKALQENYDVLLCDTSGRLHTNKNLMNELVKIKKVVQKLSPHNHQTILVLDASTGQNAIKQVKAFQDMLALDGLIITKLDGSAKGGVIIGLVNEFELPIYFLGVGEGKDELHTFDAQIFARALFSAKEYSS